MPEDFKPADLAKVETTATDSYDDAQVNNPESDSMELSTQCQSGVCTVAWKPQRTNAA
jgi:hypothetical protein